MINHDPVPYAQDAVVGQPVLVAIVDPHAGRQIINLRPEAKRPWHMELRYNGWHWHDRDGHVWQRTDEGWQHSEKCLCVRPGMTPAKLVVG